MGAKAKPITLREAERLWQAVQPVLKAARAVDRKGQVYRMVGSPQLDELHAALVAFKAAAKFIDKTEKTPK